DNESSIPAGTKPVETLPSEIKGPAWLATAFREQGMRVGPGEKPGERIIEYWKAVADTPTRIGHPSWPEGFWPSAFVEWVLNQHQIQGPKSALSRSWLKWGKTVDPPTTGCIAVFWTISPDAGSGFVGFYLSSDEDSM